MPEVLRTDVAVERHRLVGPRPVWDPATRDAVDLEVAAAQARGHAAGQIAGRRDAEQATARVVATLGAALDTLHAEVVAQRAAAATADLAVVEAVLAAVLDVCPPAAATTVLDRVREAAALLDDDVLEVRLSPDDLAVVAGASLDPRLRPIADPTLAPGDARVAGSWGRAELTRRELTRVALDAVSSGEGGA